MPKGKVNDDAKVMDVARPGKGKVVGTSRPVVAPVASDTAPAADSNPTVPDTEPAQPLAPSATHKVIQPISIDVKPDESAPADTAVQVSTGDKSSGDLPAEAEDKLLEEVSAMTAELPGDNPSEPAAEQLAEQPEANPVIETTEGEPAPTGTVPTEEPQVEVSTTETEVVTDDKPAEDTEASTEEASDAAGVDALADSVKSKKEEAKKAEEAAKREAELQGLIESKKYFVPIGHEGPKTARHHSSLWVIPVLVLVVLLAGAYLLIDAGVIKSNIKLPYEFFREDTVADSSQKTSGSASAEAAKSDEEATASSDPGTTTPESRANDDERKNELKNLQQALETYFNDNDEYPSSLVLLGLTNDQLTDPAGKAYSYTPASDKQTYTLSIKLDNSADPDAEVGVYTLHSVNQ